MKLLSIAIPCYNSEAYMRNCIESLLPGGNEVEILIVDDGSTKDNTAQIADEYEARYPGICRAIHRKTGNLARLTLSYDMAFLALLHMSLYEPQEQAGQFRCLAHPAKRRQ